MYGPKKQIYIDLLSGAPRLLWSIEFSNQENRYGAWPSDKRDIYRGNNYGFRSDDFFEPVDILYAGCSVTSGSGLDEDLIWGNILAKKINMSSANLGMPGASWQIIVDNVIGYISEIGKPKYVLCLFPDATRFTHPVDGRVVSDKKSSIIQGTIDEASGKYFTTSYVENSKDKATVIKKPYMGEDVFSEEMAIHQSFRAARRLEEYCNLSGIPLIWTTWHQVPSKLIDQEIQVDSKRKFNNYFSLKDYYGYGHLKRTKSFNKYVLLDDYSNFCQTKHRDIDCSCYVKCHESEEKQYEKTGQFHHALDVEENFASCHPGIHSHLHYVEGFLDQM